jgi:hypothetical protein
MTLCQNQQSDLISSDVYWDLFMANKPKYTCEMLYHDPKESDERLTLLSMKAAEDSLKESWDSEEDKYWNTLL